MSKLQPYCSRLQPIAHPPKLNAPLPPIKSSALVQSPPSLLSDLLEVSSMCSTISLLDRSPPPSSHSRREQNIQSPRPRSSTMESDILPGAAIISEPEEEMKEMENGKCFIIRYFCIWREMSKNRLNAVPVFYRIGTDYFHI